jgi:hypothetical protein
MTCKDVGDQEPSEIQTLTIGRYPEETAGTAIARTRLQPTVQGALTSIAWGGKDKLFAGADINAMVAELQKHAKAASSNNMVRVEEMLATQAHTLDLVFNELARVARLNLFSNLEAAERILRLSLKAQSQACRTAETLAEIKNPRPFVAVAQANVANGPQQINNGVPGPVRASARAGENAKSSNELLEHRQDEQRLDFGAASFAGAADPAMAPVAAVDGAKNGRRESES